jgi:hypothetical protein
MADGGCLCGAIRFRVSLPPKWVAHCHCTMCRRAHMAAFVTWVGVLEKSFALVHGAEVLRRHASSSAASREFCGACGSPLFFRGERWPGEVHIARAAIAGDVGMNPGLHVYFSEKVPWIHMDDSLPKRGGVSGMEPLP